MTVMNIEQFKNRVFSGTFFEDCYIDDSVDDDKPYYPCGYPWGAVYFAVDTEIIIAYGVEKSNQSPRGLLKKVKNEQFEVDFRIKPKYVETDFGIKLTYFARKVQNISTIVKNTKYSYN